MSKECSAVDALEIALINLQYESGTSCDNAKERIKQAIKGLESKGLQQHEGLLDRLYKFANDSLDALNNGETLSPAKSEFLPGILELLINYKLQRLQ